MPKLEDCAATLDMLQKFGHNEVDTARAYAGGTAEEYLGELKWQRGDLPWPRSFRLLA